MDLLRLIGRVTRVGPDWFDAALVDDAGNHSTARILNRDLLDPQRNLVREGARFWYRVVEDDYGHVEDQIEFERLRYWTAEDEARFRSSPREDLSFLEDGGTL